MANHLIEHLHRLRVDHLTLWNSRKLENNHPVGRGRTDHKYGGGVGYIAGEFPGTVTVDGQPAIREIECRMRDGNGRRVVATTWSNSDGTYKFDELNLGMEFDIIARDHTRTYRDVIVPAVKPWPYVPMLVAPIGEYIDSIDYTSNVIGGTSPYFLDDVVADEISVTLVDNVVTIIGSPLTTETFSFNLVDSNNYTTHYTGVVKVAGVTVPKLYWRIFIEQNGGDSTHSIVCELEMANTVGGPSLCVGGTPLTSSDYNAWGWTVAGAFDGDKTSFPNGWATSPGYGIPSWLGYNFGTPVAVNEIRIVSRNDSHQQYTPSVFTIQSSNDGINWDNEWAVADTTSWTPGEERSYVRPI